MNILEKKIKINSKRKSEETSCAPATPRTFWPEGLTPQKHQLEAVDFALKRNRTYLACDAGLGKTIIAALIANRTGAHVFYVCPPFLAENTNAEFDKWCFEKRLTIIPDSMIAKIETLRHISFQISCIPSDVKKILIVDEAHRFKNPSAARSSSLYGQVMEMFKKDRIIFMSGTPMPNSRPIELYPACKVLGSEMFPENRFQFGLKFCGAYKDDFGWHFDGATNKSEFRLRLFRSFMLRQKKSLLKLPPKIEGLLTVGEGIPPVVSDIEKKILAQYSPKDLIEEKITRLNGEGALHLATYLRLLGEYKLKWTIPFLKSLLEETNENILIFAVHKKTIEKLSKALKDYGPSVITGDVHKTKRQKIVNEFQTSKEKRVFIGNIDACGVGFTLTKCTRVVFVEFSWTDGANSQASDRAHRIGQDKTVLVQYVVLKDSFDRTRMEVLLKKRQNSI